MKKLLLILAFFLSTFSLKSQSLNLDWVVLQGNQSLDLGRSVERDAQGNIHVLGTISGTVDMDPGPAVLNFTTAAGESDISIQKLDTDANLLWARQLPNGAVLDTLTGDILKLDEMGSVYVGGHFSGTVDFDPGMGVANLTATPNADKDIFLLKLDSAGNFVWVKQIANASFLELRRIEIDPFGGLYTVGYFEGSLNLDPAAPASTLQANGRDIFIQKLDTTGNFQWARQIGNSEESFIQSITADNLGNLIMAGVFEDTLDADPGPGVFDLIPRVNTTSLFVLKLNPGGDFQWAFSQTFTDARGLPVAEIEHDDNNNLYIFGFYSGNIDLAPGPGAFFVNSGGGAAYLQKIDPQANLIWAKIFNTTGPRYLRMIRPRSIEWMEEGYLNLMASYNGAITYEPGLTFGNPSIPLSRGVFITRLDTSGNFKWVQSFNVFSANFIRDISSGPEDIVGVGGVKIPIDIDPGPNSYMIAADGLGPDMVIAKWSPDSCAGFFPILEQLSESNCDTPGQISILPLGSTGAVSYSWDNMPASQDSIFNYTTAGLYPFSMSDSRGCSFSTNFYLEGPPSTNFIDLQANVTSTEFRPGFPACIWVNAFNESCISASGKLEVVLDPFLQYSSSSYPPDSIKGNTLIWNFDNLDRDDGHIVAKIDVLVSTVAAIGDQVCVDMKISPDDNNTKNNAREYCLGIVNSYDPNDKQVNPRGLCEEGFIESADPLTYTIRFQNTGNSRAINVLIRDTLDTDLDWNSFKLVGQSHPGLQIEMGDEGDFSFLFAGIQLPQQSLNEAASNGYVMFELSPRPNLPVGTQILNKSAIYFDFNEAIITNEVLNTITDTLPRVDTSFIQSNACAMYELNGRVYTESGIYYQRSGDGNVCDSVKRLDVTITKLNTEVVQNGNTLVSQAGGAHGLNISYQWLDCNNGYQPIFTENQQSFTPSQNGSYAVRVSDGNCTEISDCFTVSRVGIDPDFQAQLKYYPNPSKGRVEVALGSLYQEVHVNVLNALGQKQLTKDYGAKSKLEFDLPESKGIYFIQIEADGKWAVIKVIRI